MSLTEPIPSTRPVSDLRTHLSEIEQSTKETGEPIILTRNGKPSLLVFDFASYNNQAATERHIQKLRESEIEERYRSDSYSLEQSKDRLKALRQMIETLNASD